MYKIRILKGSDPKQLEQDAQTLFNDGYLLYKTHAVELNKFMWLTLIFVHRDAIDSIYHEEM